MLGGVVGDMVVVVMAYGCVVEGFMAGVRNGSLVFMRDRVG